MTYGLHFYLYFQPFIQKRYMVVNFLRTFWGHCVRNILFKFVKRRYKKC